ncbi:MAG: bacillithiol biosynthesis cysteine-adding enzyme BshC [Armatimonadetes bacterium]|nr:bacillithiol biosynthesis cysteine-adding enzyme BshC [Armatimonadota bacterium]
MSSDTPYCNQSLAEAWSTQPLAAGFLLGLPELGTFYPYSPSPAASDAAWSARSKQAFGADRVAVSAALTDFMAPLGITEPQRRNLALLAREGTGVVITGQQPGLFGGPLYSLHKALTAVVEAARLSERGRPTVPVFWMATEDDDWAEVASTTSIDRSDNLRRLTLGASPCSCQYVGAVPLDRAVLDALLDEVAEALPSGEHSLTLVETLRGQCAAASTFGEWFARCWQALLGETGLLLLDPTHPAMRAQVAPFNELLLDDPLGPTRLAAEAGAALELLGYKPGTHRAADLCAFYLIEDGCRRRLTFDGTHLNTASGTRLTPAELRKRLANDPTIISHGVLTRPVAQDYLLPTAGFVLGPGEIAYAAQVAPIYDHLGIARPHLLPRRSLTLVPPKAARTLEQYHLRPCDLLVPRETLISRVVRDQEGAETTAVVETARAAIAAALAPVIDHASAVDATLAKPAEGLVNRFGSELEKLEKSVQRALRQRAEVHVRRLSAAHAWLAPDGRSQERVLGMLPFLAVVGPTLVERVQQAVASTPWDQHGVVQLGHE